VPVELAKIEHGENSGAEFGAAFDANSNDRGSMAHRMIGFHDFRYPRTQFRISLFAGHSVPPAASLVKRAYSRLGYATGDGQSISACETAATASLQAAQRNTTLGTLSVNLDGKDGLRAEALYPLEVAQLRRQGALCEFTQLALDTELAGREVLCSLFYMAYVFSHWCMGPRTCLSRSTHAINASTSACWDSAGSARRGFASGSAHRQCCCTSISSSLAGRSNEPGKD